MTAQVNAAARANLERVVAEEQRSAALRMAWLRFGVAVVLLVLQLLSPMRSVPMLAPTLWGTAVFAVVSAALLALTRNWAWAGRWGAYAVPFLDIPMVALVQHLQAPWLDYPLDGVPTAIAIPLSLVGLSILSMSRPVIVLSAVAASVAIVRRMLSLEIEGHGLLLTAGMPLALSVVGLAVVSRMRALLLASRKRDLVGKYILGERLGAGGMAEVFAATYSPEGGFERKVAVKRILPGQMERPDAVALFRREAEIGAALAHPNVVQVLDFGLEGDGCFIAMEFVDGAPLSRVLAAAQLSGRLSIPCCVYVLEQLANALDYIHTRTTPSGTSLRLIHRDVNPPNIMVSRLGEVKLNDFGVARTDGAHRLTVTGQLRGKLGYAAPEQLRGTSYDARADLWALGVTAFELLTLTRPFEGSDDAAIVRSILEDPVPRPLTRRADIRPELERLVMGLLERDPALRPASAAEVRSALAAVEGNRDDGKRALAAAVATSMTAGSRPPQLETPRLPAPVSTPRG